MPALSCGSPTGRLRLRCRLLRWTMLYTKIHFFVLVLSLCNIFNHTAEATVGRLALILADPSAV